MPTSPQTPKRLPRGSGMNRVGILVKVEPDDKKSLAQRAAELGMTERAWVYEAILRELKDPTIPPVPMEQEEFPLGQTG